jgi:hypothetical protein
MREMIQEPKSALTLPFVSWRALGWPEGGRPPEEVHSPPQPKRDDQDQRGEVGGPGKALNPRLRSEHRQGGCTPG